MLSRREILGLLPVMVCAVALPSGDRKPLVIDSDASLDDITKEFLYLTGVVSWLEATHKEAFTVLAQTLPEKFASLDPKFSSNEYWHEQTHKHSKVLEDHFESSLNKLAAEFQRTFTREDMCNIIEFYRSPVAQKMVETSSMITGFKDVQLGLQKEVMKAIEPEFATYYKT